jgi:hypothetical protein
VVAVELTVQAEPMELRVQMEHQVPVVPTEPVGPLELTVRRVLRELTEHQV